MGKWEVLKEEEEEKYVKRYVVSGVWITQVRVGIRSYKAAASMRFFITLFGLKMLIIQSIRYGKCMKDIEAKKLLFSKKVYNQF